MPDKMCVVGYVRVSREEQKHGDGPRAQRQDIERWAHENDATLIGIIEDLGTSGAVTPSQRQKVREAIELAAEHEAEGLVVAKADRWTRGGIGDSHLSRAWLANEHRLTVQYADMPFGMDRLLSDIILAMRDAMAEDWLRTHKDRVRRGVKAAMRRGWPKGRPGRKPKPELSLEEKEYLGVVLPDLDVGWGKMALKVSSMRGAFDVATVEYQRKKSVSETWLRAKAIQCAKENRLISLGLDARGIEWRESKVDKKTDGET